MEATHRVLIRNLREHSRLTREDLDEIGSLSYSIRQLEADEDCICQGDVPKVAALVVSGMAARCHLLGNGRRQYLSFHMSGDLPDAQGLFVTHMDHALCALGPAAFASIPHSEMIKALVRRPAFGFAVWRETLIDAAIFREAIANNSARGARARMAHLFCELFYRARAFGLTNGNSVTLPISLGKLGESLGMAIATVNRSLQTLRASQALEFRDGELIVKDWRQLQRLGEFDPNYLQSKRIP
jgi:CRP-like cAMP-binding protein